MRTHRWQRVAAAEHYVLTQIPHNTGFISIDGGCRQANKARTGAAPVRACGRTRE